MCGKAILILNGVMKSLINFIFLMWFTTPLLGQKIISGPILLPENDSIDTFWVLLKNGNETLFSSSSSLSIIEDTLVSSFTKRNSAYQLKVTKDSSYFLNVKNIKGDIIFSKEMYSEHIYDDRFLFGSCAFIPNGLSSIYRPYKMNKIYRSMAKEKVGKMFWLGDNIYLWPKSVTSSIKKIYQAYLSIRKDRSLNRFLSNGVEHFAIWDDHDFGPNNSSGFFENAHLTTRSFNNFWNNFTVRDSGIYKVVHHEKIDFFLMDTRTFYKVGRGSFLGEKQLEWLKFNLTNSKAKFKFILFSNQVLNPKTNHETINRGLYKKEKDLILDFISKENIKGVVFFSGDRHFAEIHKLNYPNLSYPLYDFTTSPLSSPRHHLFFIEEKKNVKTRVPGSFYSNKNFLKCIVENVNNTDILKFQYKNKNGKIVFQQSLSEYDLGY